jgi:hypothetical protein
MTRLIVVVSLCTFSSAALAEEDGRPDFELALTAAPLLDLSLPFVPGLEVTSEWAAGQKFGVGFVGGIGSNLGVVWLGGLQANGYVMGDFSTGLLLGAEYTLHTLPSVGALHSSTGAYVGGKYAFPFGLTLMLHGGAAWNFTRFDVGLGEIGPLVNAGLGWSF